MDTTIILHQTQHSIADFRSIFSGIQNALRGNGLHLFPELHLCGYPLQDIVFHKSFIKRYQDCLKELNRWVRHRPETRWRALMGGLSYEFDESTDPIRIENVIYEAIPGIGMKKLYAKQLLPSYGIFDDKRYFTAGKRKCLYSFEGKKFGLLICEDMWHSSSYDQDPIDDFVGDRLDGIINLSASPFDFAKHGKRLSRAKDISHYMGCPFIYVNRVGGEDEVLFDGRSFIVNGDNVVSELKSFVPETREVNLPSTVSKVQKRMKMAKPNVWNDYYLPRWVPDHMPPKLRPLSDSECGSILEALCFGLQEYARKNDFTSFLVGLSGGIDSALALSIASLSKRKGQHIEAIYMPSEFSSPLSMKLAENLCQSLSLQLDVFPISDLHQTIDGHFRRYLNQPLSGVADENIQSRLRGNLLYARSNQTGSMVLNTSNRSEIAIGYSTLYGDSVGALSLLGDLYKTDVFRLAEYINAFHGELIPKEIISRAPTAELRTDQTDEQALPPYEKLDAILEGIHLPPDELVERGFDKDQVKLVFNLFHRSEYKRQQFCPILKVGGVRNLV